MVFQCGKEVGKSSFSSVDIMCVHLMFINRVPLCGNANLCALDICEL